MRRFGQFLVARGLVGPADLRRALELQEATIVPLGSLAVERRLLTPAQVDELRRAQRVVDKRIGEIALERDWLTGDQLAGLLESQAARRQLLGELLITQGTVARDDMTSALAEYEAMEAGHDEQMQHLLHTLPAAELIRALLDFTAKHFLRTFRDPVKISSLSFERALSLSQLDPLSTLFFSQSANGEYRLVYGLLLDETSALDLASHLLDERRDRVDELVLDSLCEFVNMILGNCLARLEGEGIRLRPEPPSFCTAEEAARRLPGCTRIELIHRRGAVNAVVSISEADRG